MKKWFIVIITLVICLCGCNSEDDDCTVAFSTLDLDITTNWGIEAIDYGTFDTQNIKIAVIDRIGYVEAPGITYHSVVDNANRPVEHGSYVLAILREMLPTADFLAINIAAGDGEIEPTSLAEGIEYALDAGCHVINVSLGSQTNYPEVEKQIARVADLQCVIVAACGNESKQALDYPAGYNNVVSVMARNIDNIDFDNNNTSETKKSFAAPGSVVFNETKLVSGSSIATAYVTAEVAYVLSVKPNITNNDLQKLLVDSSIFESQYSYGIINHSLLTQNIQE